MTNLFLDRILEFYGVPQILVAKDSFGTQYLCLLFDDGAGCRYTGIKISSSRLDGLLGGRIDLRTLYLNRRMTMNISMCLIMIIIMSYSLLRERPCRRKGFRKRDIFMWNHGLRSIR